MIQKEPVLKFIRMVTGEDLVSEYIEVSDESGDYIILHKPMKVVYIANKSIPNRISISLMQWIFGNICEEQMFILSPNDVLTMGTPNKDLAEYYYQLINPTDFLDLFEKSEPTEEDLKKLEEEALSVTDEEVEQVKNFLAKTAAEKKKLLH